MPKFVDRPKSPQELASARTKAFRAGDDLTLGEQESVFASSLQSISRYIEDNQAGLRNIRKHKSADDGQLRVISDIGFSQLAKAYNAAGATGTKSPKLLFPHGDGWKGPHFQFLAPKPSTIVKTDIDKTVFVIHAFGDGFDKRILDNNRAVKSVSVDPGTGHNPARYFNGIATLTHSKTRNVSVQHIISRRGDLTNSAPWDVTAQHANSNFVTDVGAGYKIDRHSIGMELEQHFVRHDKEKKVNVIANMRPYTEEQFTVMAFIFKKYIAWTKNEAVLNWLGPGAEGIVAAVSGATGMINHNAVSSPGSAHHSDPNGEFEFPQGFVKGVEGVIQPLPPHLLTGRPGQWRIRIEKFWGHVPAGTYLSAWDRVFSKVNRIRPFKLATEVFDLTLATGRIKLNVPTIIGTHKAALAAAAARNRIAQYDRSQRMGQTSRGGFYDSAAVNSSAVGVAIAQHSRSLREARQLAAASVALVKNATGFDFTTGLWVTRDTVNKI